METIEIDELTLIGGTQVRTVRDTPTELMYQEVMTEAGTNTMFPPISVYRDSDGSLWIADGHHRVAASIGAGLTTIVAEVREGTKAQAIEAAVVANRHNGLPMSKSDRFHAMEMLLETTPGYTDGALAEILGMPRQTVNDWRKQIQVADFGNLKRTGKDGKTYPAKNPRKSPPSAPVSPRSPSPAKPTQNTTPQPTPQPAQTWATEADPYERFDILWREIAERMNPFKGRLQEYRNFCGDGEYNNKVFEIFEI